MPPALALTAPSSPSTAPGLTEALLTSQLFGHRRGAFTGAVADQAGFFEAAQGSTLFLDEIGDLPLAMQSSLLRAIEEKEIVRLGDAQARRVDVRVLAATHRDLRAAVDAGRFREDLYYRLAVFPVHLPALRDRVEDIGPLSATILHELAVRTGRGPWRLHPDALDALRAAPWRGNVRELVNVLERATILASKGEISVDDLLLQAPAARPAGGFPDFAANERQYFERLLEACTGRITGEGGAAERAGLAPSTLRSKLEKHGLL